MATFSRQITSQRSRVEVLGAALDSLGKPLREFGYSLESQTPDGVVWRRGLYSALLRGSGRVTISLTDGVDGGTVITIAGDGPRRLAKAFNKLDM
jgi:hypothetical protein